MPGIARSEYPLPLEFRAGRRHFLCFPVENSHSTITRRPQFNHKTYFANPKRTKSNSITQKLRPPTSQKISSSMSSLESVLFSPAPDSCTPYSNPHPPPPPKLEHNSLNSISLYAIYTFISLTKYTNNIFVVYFIVFLILIFNKKLILKN